MGLFLALLFLSAIIYLMGLFNWGSLPKDQTNPQLITEAITEAIIAHEEDPTAHLGPGESLEQHKTNEVIDHPAASVLPDKLGSSDYTLDFVFQTVDGFSTYGSILAGEMTAFISVDTPTIPYSILSFVPFPEILYSSTKFSILLQFSAWREDDGTDTTKIEWCRIGIEIERDRVRGYSYINDDSVKTYTDWYSSNDENVHSYRALYQKNDNLVYFSVDGVEIGTLSDELVPKSEDLYFRVRMDAISSSASIFHLLSAKTSLYER